MKALFAGLTVLAACSISFASEKASIQCSQENEFKIATLEKRDETMFGCEGFSHGVNVCFTGESATALKILKGLNSDGVLGDEFEMRRMRARKDALKYDAYDLPNGEVAASIVVSRCFEKADAKDTAADTTVSSDSKNSCADLAVGAVTLIRKKSTNSETEVSVGLISEDDSAAFFKVELITPVSKKHNQVVADNYEVVMKSSNCEVIAVRKYSK